MYERYIKRLLDFFLALLTLLILFPLLLILTCVGAVVMRGNPFFVQVRPGKDEKLFRLLKFRSMTNRKSANGELLPDEERLTKYGRLLRLTSADELPELINILIGDMAIVGPRPQLVRDMVFMTPLQRQRHSVRPGLTGLAQVSGRNALRWDKKLKIDLDYIHNISFMGDLKIIWTTARLVLLGEEAEEATDVVEDFGDFLLENGSVSEEEYRQKQAEAKELLRV